MMLTPVKPIDGNLLMESSDGNLRSIEAIELEAVQNISWIFFAVNTHS